MKGYSAENNLWPYDSDPATAVNPLRAFLAEP